MLSATSLFRLYPSFSLYWLTRILTTMSFQIISVVIGWQVYQLTGSAFSLGLVGLMQFMPLLLLTLPAGVLADRYDRRRILLASRLLGGFTALLLAIWSHNGWLLASGIFAAVTMIGVGRAFENPANASLLPSVVPEKDLPQALALATSATQTATIIGPALGGLLYLAGPWVAYLVVAILYVAAALLVRFIQLLRRVQNPEPVRLSSLFSGFTFIRKRPLILGAISLDMVAVLLGGATALLPIYAQDILKVGPLGLGFLRMAPAIGALVMSVVLTRYPLHRHAGRFMFAAVIVFGLATLVFGLSTWFPLSFLALLVLGAADVVSVVVRSSLVQLGTPDNMRGRVSAINFVFIGTSNQLGEFESGMTAGLFGTVPAVVMGGVGTILAAMLWMRLFPDLRRVSDLRTAHH